MMNDLYTAQYNPDVLSCLANLSNDEVFTPPEIVNKMLDMLPEEVWTDKNATFLDPACKSGVFLREIAKRLLEGLKEEIPDRQERIDHIFHKQLYGISITELTSLLSRRSVYCSKYPNSKYSVSMFENASGNIRYKRINHKWKNGRCVFCGASKSEYKRDKALETHAYEFIHTTKPERIFNMKFDVIIGNPPYQLSDGGGTGSSAKPIYQHFIRQAKKLKPRYLSMIVPSRWFAGGKGLDKFRKEMLADKHIQKLTDYENFKDVFPGVDLAGGACYFLWVRDTENICEVTNFDDSKPNTVYRHLNEFDVFIRQNKAIPIVRKIKQIHGDNEYLDAFVSSRMPFGIPSTYKPLERGIPCYFTQRIGFKYANILDMNDNLDLLDKWKLIIPKAPIAGQTDFSKEVKFFYDGNTKILKPGECCAESWLVAGHFNTKEETIAYKSYIFTKIVRFLLLQTVVSQNISKKNFCFIPKIKEYRGIYTDELLKKRWNITDEEWEFIDSKIASIGGEENGK